MNNENSDYKVKVLRTAIIMCWVLLISCFLFKLFGSKVFEIAAVDPSFINACNWLDGEGVWCKYLIGFCFAVPGNIFILIASSLKPKISRKWLIALICINIPIWFLKVYYPIPGFVVECIMFIVLPALISKKWWVGFAGLIINLIFQILSIIIRGHAPAIVQANTILSIIVALDYYIMIALFYLYVKVINNKKIKKEE